MNIISDNNQWDLVIEPHGNLFRTNLKQLWEYRDLIKMFVKRDIVTVYKQTILGPVWFVLQPLFTMGIFVLVFDKIAGISTDETPPVLFYLAGIVIWNYFADSLTETSDTFYRHSEIFGKVYFPRIILPISKIISGTIKLLIQLSLFLLFLLFYIYRGAHTGINISVLLSPYLIMLVALLSLGTGILLSSFTIKYRDLSFVITFGMQLYMYATPVIYPLSAVPEQYQWLIIWNPMAHVVEGFKHAFLGTGQLTLFGLLYATLITVTLLSAGVFLFNRAERNFMDSV